MVNKEARKTSRDADPSTPLESNNKKEASANNRHRDKTNADAPTDRHESKTVEGKRVRANRAHRVTVTKNKQPSTKNEEGILDEKLRISNRGMQHGKQDQRSTVNTDGGDDELSKKKKKSSSKKSDKRTQDERRSGANLRQYQDKFGANRQARTTVDRNAVSSEPSGKAAERGSNLQKFREKCNRNERAQKGNGRPSNHQADDSVPLQTQETNVPLETETTSPNNQQEIPPMSGSVVVQAEIVEMGQLEAQFRQQFIAEAVVAEPTPMDNNHVAGETGNKRRRRINRKLLYILIGMVVVIVVVVAIAAVLLSDEGGDPSPLTQTNPQIDRPSNPRTDLPGTDTPTHRPTDPSTDPPTQPPTHPPTDPPTQPPTRPPSRHPTRAPTRAPCYWTGCSEGGCAPSYYEADSDLCFNLYYNEYCCPNS